MKKLLWLSLIFAMAIPAFAEIKVTGHAPTVTGTGAEIFNAQTETAFQEALNELNDELKVFQSPNKFLRAMGDSSVYASHGATTRGYGDYKHFSATIGSMVGAQLPSGITSIMDDVDGLQDSLDKEGDVKLGFSPNLFNVNFGLNMSMLKFVPEKLGVLKRDNLYVGLRVGYFKLPGMDMGDDSSLSYSNITLGLTANYQLIPSIKLPFLLTWRGLNVGSGFIYNQSKLGFSLPVDEVEQDIDGTTSIVLKDNKASLSLTTNTFTIPLEAITAVKLLIFNIPFGLGADIAFGKTSLGARVDSTVGYRGLEGTGLTQNKEGDITVDGGLSHSPSIFNFKIMTGLGISAGPVVIDIPITFYPATGYNFGLTIGAVW